LSGHIDDGVLIAATAAGNSGAFSQLYSKFYSKMVRYARTILIGNSSDADDAYNAAFLDIWRIAGSYSGQGSAEGWIRRIVRNKAVDLGRGIKERPLSSEAQVLAHMNRPDQGTNPEDTAIASSEAKSLHSALTQLSADHREVVWLCYFETKGLSEIATIMDCPENTVKTRLYHARKQLHAIMVGPKS
jgi:RNA polymerase sigma-70 factor, ECF subfamily